VKKGWHWPVILGLLMAVVIGANLILIVVATTDPSFAVEENYYRKALAWDDKREQDRRNVELGWTIEFEMAGTPAPDGTLRLRARLLDAQGMEIPDATIRLEAFHNARARRILRAELVRGEDGTYSAPLLIRRPGLWEFRFEALRGAERFTYTALEDVSWR
jgi:nitrogen fixation protein FixH